MNKMLPLVLASTIGVYGCSSEKATVVNVDTLIQNGKVYLGDLSGEQKLDVAICGDVICGVFAPNSQSVSAKTIIDARGQIVSPGFIDPHTHTMDELLSKDENHNLNYLTQGVTTVVNGNDGGGYYQIAELAELLEQNGIGTNVALLVGHNQVRTAVMGRENRHASEAEVKQMQTLVDDAMKQGALGLSTGLYYVPGSYASTDEVVALAQTAAKYQGIYDTHLRDEATFNIGFIAALEEAIHITSTAGIHLHLAHIKALGVDAWGLSKDAIEIIEVAQKNGASISADQYPWLASGTKLHNAIMPKWVMADSKAAFYERLNTPELKTQLVAEISENIRRRGGPEALLVTAFDDPNLVGKTLKQLAQELELPPAEAAMNLVQRGAIRVASFNMSEADLANFMKKDWVVTSSDGTNGHPRKYASFPKKFDTYVKDKKYLSIDEFVSRSSGQTAKVLGIEQRGLIKQGYAADIIIWDENEYRAKADFSNWNQLSTGINEAWVNGQQVISQGLYNQKLAGRFVAKTIEQ